MSRLAVAAILALAVHGAFFWVEVPWERPVLPLRQSRSVDIDLQTIRMPAEQPGPAMPEATEPRPVKVEAKPGNVQPKHPKRPDRSVKPDARTPAARPAAARQAQPKPAAPPPLSQPEAPASEPSLSVDAAFDEKVTRNPLENDSPPSATLPAVKVSVPLYELNPPPVYPRIARRRNYQGTVLLDVRVTAGGRAAEVKVAHSSGYGVLDRSAVAAVRDWRFEPARRGSQAIETWVEVPVKFELK